MAVKSIQELIELKNQKKEEIKTFYVKSIDSDVRFKMATWSEAVAARKMESQDMDLYMIFSHVIEPNLKDPKLQEALNKNGQPWEIVEKLFSVKEIGELSMEIAGQKEKDPIKEIKNS